MVKNISEMTIHQFPRITQNITPSYCFDDCIATYAGFMQVDFQTLYFHTLENEFTNNISNGLGNSYKSNFNIDDALLAFTPIRSIKHSNEFEPAIKAIKDKIKSNTAVSINMLGYYCPWDWRFNEIKTGAHTFFIVDFDESKSRIKCLDPYYGKNNIYMSIEQLEKGYISYREFSISDLYKPIEPMTELQKSLNKLIENKYLDSQMELSLRIVDHFDPKLEIKDFKNIDHYSLDEVHENTYLNLALKTMVQNIIRFTVLLYKFDAWYPQYNGSFKILADKMKVICEKWEMLRYMFLKLLVVHDSHKMLDSISRKMGSIVKEQTDLVYEILHFAEKKFSIKKPRKLPFVQSGYSSVIQIQPHFNNIGIGEDANSEADLNGVGEFIIADSIQYTENISRSMIDFVKTNIKNGKPDNISCLKQTIEIPCDYYVSFSVLGCSEWGTYNEYFKLIYSDESSDDILVELFDWTPDCSKKSNKKLALQCEKSIYNGAGIEDYTENCFLFSVKYNINYQKKIKEIILPECENMHVFCLNFTKKL